MKDDREQFDLVIVGMGSGGIVAAEFAATIGLRTAVIERGRFGGDCLWTGCVPSKALIAAARAVHTMRHADALGLPAVTPDVDLGAVLQRIRAVQADIAATDDDPARFEAMGITVVAGTARLIGPNEITVDNERVIEARTILLCTGSRPAVPAIPGLEQARFLTSDTLWDAEPPRSIVLIGSGPVVVELAQALARLGVAVTLCCGEASILPRDEPDLAAMLAGVLERDGVRLHIGAEVTSVERNADGVTVNFLVSGEPSRAAAEAVFIGVGRVPSVDKLDLDAAGIDMGPEGIVVDDRGRTSVRSVYVAGDLAGRHLFTHSAGHEAVRAVRDAFFPGAGKVPSLVPWCTFTDPELAHAGLTVAEAEERHGADVDVWRLDLAHNDRARTDGATNGAIVIVTAKAKVVGAHILAPAAGEMIHELALAIQQGLTISDLAGLVHVYPTLATGVGQLAAEAAYEKAQKLRWLVRRGR
jgi:pyruvate/2-oxoglutarate dehydrogenase complex dihydrolipoamide dehydrogenase (E3) component